MVHKTVLLPIEKAAQVQQTAKDFNCVVLNVAVSSNNNARISVTGEEEDMKALFESIGETLEV